MYIKIEVSKLPTRPHDTVLVRFSWALSYVIHVIFMMYYTVMFCWAFGMADHPGNYSLRDHPGVVS